MPCLFHYVLLIVLSLSFFMLHSCTVDPEEGNVKDSIIKHFMSRDYRVVDMEIGRIEPLPISQREYMAPKKYTVNIPLIILESTRDRPDMEKGQMMFRNAVITLSSTERHGEWAVVHITGIPVT